MPTPTTNQPPVRPSAHRAESDAARLEADAHDLIARGHALLAQAARLRLLLAPAHGCDGLVALAESGLDARARRRLEIEGRIPVTKIGRRKYTTRSALAALVSDVVPQPAPASRRESPEQAARRAYTGLGGTPRNNNSNR